MSGVSRARLLRGGIKAVAPSPLRPPWALSDGGMADGAAFAAACTGCGACVPACADGLIVMGPDQLPVVSFAAAGCSFCGDCVAACAPGALRRDEGRPAWPHVARIGAACLSYQGVECRSCGDHCSENAIAFQPLGGGRRLPAVSAACTGCGACVGPCPVQAVAMTSGVPAAPACLSLAPTLSADQGDSPCA